MEPSRPPRSKLFRSALLIGIAAGVCLSLWQVRQGQLDSALIAAVETDDAHSAIDLLDQGADANAAKRVGRPESLDLVWRDLQSWLHGRRPPQRSYIAPALYLVYTHEQKGNPSPGKPGVLWLNGEIVRANSWFFDPARSRPEQLALVSALLRHGADPNRYPGSAGPLHFEVHMRHRESVKLLLKHGANPNTRTGSLSSSPLAYADPECAEMLIQHGADVNMRLRFGDTLLMTAVTHEGRDRSSRDGLARLDVLLRHGADVNAHDKTGQTALMHAVNVPYARLLLDHGAEIDARTSSGTTALMMSCAHGVDLALPGFLIARGALASAKDNKGRRARDYATEFRHFPGSSKLCRMLDMTEAFERVAGGAEGVKRATE